MDIVANKAKRHPIFAFFIDGYFCGGLLNLIHGFFGWSIGITLVVALLLFAAGLFYHFKYYDFTTFKTFGEWISGTVMVNDHKENVNPFTKSRLVLWAITLFEMYSVQHSTSNVGRLPADEFLFVLGLIVLIMISLVLINSGKKFGIVLFSFYGFLRIIIIITSGQKVNFVDLLDVFITIFFFEYLRVFSNA